MVEKWDNEHTHTHTDTRTKHTKSSVGTWTTICAMQGVVKKWDNDRGFGFITPNNGDGDLFVHQSGIKMEGYRALSNGEAVEYQLTTDDAGRQKAVEVTGPNGSELKSKDGSARGGEVAPRHRVAPFRIHSVSWPVFSRIRKAPFAVQGPNSWEPGDDVKCANSLEY